MCNPGFLYMPQHMNPKRELTLPAEGVYNNGWDNIDNDYILKVADLIVTPEGKEYTYYIVFIQFRYEILDSLGKGTFG